MHQTHSKALLNKTLKITRELQFGKVMNLGLQAEVQECFGVCTTSWGFAIVAPACQWQCFQSVAGSCLGWGSSRFLAEEQREELGHPLAGTAW